MLSSILNINFKHFVRLFGFFAFRECFVAQHMLRDLRQHIEHSPKTTGDVVARAKDTRRT